jgi:ArsR family transcriptional regulator
VRRDEAAERLKALGHPVRLAIVRALAERSCCCCGDVCSRLPLAQSTVSQHLKVLREAGLISFRRDGVRSSYVLNPSAFAALNSDLEDILALVVRTGGDGAARRGDSDGG